VHPTTLRSTHDISWWNSPFAEPLFLDTMSEETIYRSLEERLATKEKSYIGRRHEDRNVIFSSLLDPQVMTRRRSSSRIGRLQGEASDGHSRTSA
jgi:hypothetical protein